MLEWNNAKDESRYKKYGEVSRGYGEKGPPETMKKLMDEGLLKMKGWADSTGRIIYWFEFENMEAFGKMWADQEFQSKLLRYNPLVDNMRVSILRPSVPVPED